MSTTFILSALAAAAIVQNDGVSLRSAARDSAAEHAALTQGDLLEVRGQRLDYLQVYDHRRERAGYVKATSVRPINLDATQMPHFLSVVRFLRDSSNQEALGISYAQSYLKVSGGATKDPDYAEVLDAVGKMADRLAARTAKQASKDHTAQQIEGVGFLGVRMVSIDQHGQQRLCYDGKAYEQLLGLDVPPSYKLNATLALTQPNCIDSGLTIVQRRDLDASRLRTLDTLKESDLTALTGLERNRYRHRKAAVLASLSFATQRALNNGIALGTASSDAMQSVKLYAAQAIENLAAVDKGELSDQDKAQYDETALRVGAIRLAAQPAVVLPKTMSIVAGEPGQTCLVVDTARRCTYGVVWPQSLSVSPNGLMMSIAVQPTETWREVWLLRKVDNTWVVDVLPPSTEAPNLGSGVGVVEFAGWVPADTKQEARILVARDTLEKTKVQTRFEVLRAASLSVEARANHPQTLFAFAKFQQASWRAATLTVR
jgi:hypothetical protein